MTHPARPAATALLSALLVALPLTLLGACAGTAPQRGGAAPAGPAPTSTSGSYGGDAEAAPSSASARMESAPAGADADADAWEPEEANDRPGLGTVFGETRQSQIQRVSFERAGAAPFSTVVLHYNDAEGVRAHSSWLGQRGVAPLRAYTDGGGISISLLDEQGRLLPGGSAGGKTFVVGQEGQRYEIVLHNETAGRFEAVASVDGLDVIDGEPAHAGKRGYILEPYSSVRIDGWRRSESHVAAFRFGRVQDSYAARTSGDRNVGVIGVALFAEAGSRWTSDELHRRDTADPFPGSHGYAQPPL
ncbi:hypothetical protein [Haliangium sp.]|uniref:hypothetical protein n=1 Tax=Haliangium sp. TaxID=2663208 RepID=UPI003D0BFD87